MLDAVIREMAQNLHGSFATDQDIRFLRSSISKVLLPDWFVDLLIQTRLSGVHFSLTEYDDESKLGADVIWLTPRQIVSEATESQPGISIVPLGYLPIGACALGSGDPYFLDMREAINDPPVVRVPHDYAGKAPYPLDRVERVTDSLSGFFRKAKL